MEGPSFFDTRFGRWIPALLTLAIPASMLWVGAKWSSIVEWWKAPWIGTFVIAITLVAAGVALMARKLFPWEKAIYFVLLGGLSLLEFRSLKISDDRSKNAQKELNNSFSALLERAKDAISNMTGGDSWPHLEVMTGDVDGHFGGFALQLVVEGCCSLRHVKVRVIDQERYQNVSRSRNITLGDIWGGDVAPMVDLGDMSKGLNVIEKPIGIDLQSSTRRFYVIEISALNGTWREYLATELVPDHLGISEKVVVFDCRYKGCEGEVKRLS